MEDKYKIRIAVAAFMGWRNKPTKNNPHVYTDGISHVRTYHDLPPFDSCMRECNRFEFALYNKSIILFAMYIEALDKAECPRDINDDYRMGFNCLMATPLERCRALLSVL